ncbi:hypothetical protein [cf. Phormidesmis sp. LEGE 11477]|uniref:hypothetical protein n=1 Tax=cf. Phormidesmis sp. LEGE 11477 TaxID=1828680 RepID=UPI001880A8C3|nr:hypothetical protein [cf. Phormidesmis sp. LEGE 11477]MBE9062384.1 hypothetical protein [cf. Phormidesmis sp. LEGE 11477]
MAKEATLKKQNLKYIQAFIALNILLFCWQVTKISLIDIYQTDSIPIDWIKKLQIFSLLAAITFIITNILCGLIKSECKSILVFFRLRNPLPGSRAFSKLMVLDPRINEDVLRQKFGLLPQEPKAQNKLWYALYKQHENHQIVLEAHKSYLLMRELMSVSLILSLILGIFGFWLGADATFLLLHVFILYGIAISTAISGRNYGERFVTNVLAIESSQYVRAVEI